MGDCICIDLLGDGLGLREFAPLDLLDRELNPGLVCTFDTAVPFFCCNPRLRLFALRTYEFEPLPNYLEGGLYSFT